ncbi:MAG: von Willebrand factor type A domain-containing protein [Ignavibacteriales bacterium]|nr:von Willebrand factor type A domain-containing protein [Ignavibacteriales bacterium]
MKDIKYLLICILFNSLILAQYGALKGKVIDAQAGEILIGANVVIEGTTIGTATDANGEFHIFQIPVGTYTLKSSYIGYATISIKDVIINAGLVTEIIIELPPSAYECETVVVQAVTPMVRKDCTTSIQTTKLHDNSNYNITSGVVNNSNIQLRGGRTDNIGYYIDDDEKFVDFNTESYNAIYENEFRDTEVEPLSTFSIDVDAASYSNMRRFIMSSTLPPKDAIRIEELINYFDYDYEIPEEKPFSINYEVGSCPWNEDAYLVHIGLQGKKIVGDELPPSNLVFLIDVSGSMESDIKLPLLIKSFKLMVNELRNEDRVSIVVYAGAAGLVLESTPGSEKEKIIAALDKLKAGGTTAGGAGIKLAYKIAQENFIEGGNNRVILATDGDFNTGASSDAEMIRLIEEKREDGVFLTVLGFGIGNYKDSKMEQIADKGNGNYYYIDNLMEGKKVLVNNLTANLFTIAKDVKIQIEFNPAKVKAYRLVGYENRILNKEDFNDDKKDAGELGAGHTVTALYEIILTDSDLELDISKVDELKYQTIKVSEEAFETNELMNVKLRYKNPDEDVSKLIQMPIKEKDIKDEDLSDNFIFAAAVAEYGMLLRDSKFKGDSNYDDVIEMAKESKGEDRFGYRTEFIKIVETTNLLSKTL